MHRRKFIAALPLVLAGCKFTMRKRRFLLPVSTTGPITPAVYTPGHYISMGKNTDDQSDMAAYTGWTNVRGFTKFVEWINMETSQGVYDFSALLSDLDWAYANGMRMIFIMADKTFSNAAAPSIEHILPSYLQSYEMRNNGGTSSIPDTPAYGGFTAKRWDPNVYNAAIALFDAMANSSGGSLAAKFKNHPALEGVGTQETSLSMPATPAQADPGYDDLQTEGYTPEAYRDSYLTLLPAAQASFDTRHIFWHMNFLTQHQSYLQDIANAVAPLGVYMGSPDTFPEANNYKTLVYPIYTSMYGKMKMFERISVPEYSYLKWPDAPITAIARAPGAQTTISTVSVSHPYAVGHTVTYTGCTGMTQINGQNAVVQTISGSSGAWKFTTTIDSSSYGTYTGSGVSNRYWTMQEVCSFILNTDNYHDVTLFIPSPKCNYVWWMQGGGVYNLNNEGRAVIADPANQPPP